ncbi:SMI1/KNR4 family protein [Micromonospora sp. NPDC050200]|uniref:SMI1/KNR4 family protein n=1 Tax=Micromonospora sp. NPDC050200 TaxID=3155664 RepID=UPI0033F03520
MFDSDSFRQVVAPPDRAPTAVDWDTVEARMGVLLPSDYKWLVENYGPGLFGGFFYILYPGSSRKGLDLEYQHERTTWALEYLAERGHSLPRNPADLLSFGRSENGDVAYWVIGQRDDPDRWSVALGEPRGPLWEEYDGGAVEWLGAVLSRRIRMNIFPKDFPRRTVRFSPLA